MLNRSSPSPPRPPSLSLHCLACIDEFGNLGGAPECAESGRLTALANSVLLRSLGAAKMAATLTRKASSSVLGLPRAPTAYTVRIDTEDGGVREVGVVSLSFQTTGCNHPLSDTTGASSLGGVGGPCRWEGRGGAWLSTLLDFNERCLSCASLPSWRCGSCAAGQQVAPIEFCLVSGPPVLQFLAAAL